jgi:hypothetical protein
MTPGTIEPMSDTLEICSALTASALRTAAIEIGTSCTLCSRF